MGQTSSAFRLSVWKPANPIRRLMACSAEQSHLDCELHEQVYSWEPDEDIWGSLIDGEQTRRARSALIEQFDPSRSAKDRSISHLHEALTVLTDILRIPGATAWSECNESVQAPGDDQVNLRANTVLLLFRHLEWIWNIFRHVPGASVTVR